MTSCLNIERQWYKNCGRRRKRWVHLSYRCSRLSCLSKSVGTASWTAPKGTSYITWNFIGKTGGLIRVVANSGSLTGLAPLNKAHGPLHHTTALSGSLLVFLPRLPGPRFFQQFSLYWRWNSMFEWVLGSFHSKWHNRLLSLRHCTQESLHPL